jgi:hypothetical protein
MQERGVWEQIFVGLGDAIADIREKAEEAIWGREVTERGEHMPWPQAPERQQQSERTYGEILPPEHSASHEAGPWPRLESGAVLEGQAEYIREDTPRLQWSQARESQPEVGEHDRDSAADIDIDR